MELEVESGSDVGIGILLEREIDVEADGFASGFVGAEIGSFHDAGTTAGGDDEAAAAGGNLNGPLSEKVGEAARVLIVTGHIDGGDGSLEIGFMLGGGRFRGFFNCRQVLACGSGSLETGRAEEDDSVLNLFAAKTSERFLILGEDAENAPVGTAEKRFVLVSERRGVELV